MPVSPKPGVSWATVDRLRGRLRGDFALPGEPGYDLARSWNTATTSQPAGVVIAADVDDVRTAVRWAGARGLRVAVHATGHGTVAHGDDVVVVHTGRLQECTIDPEQRVARVGAGVRTQRLLDAAHDHSLAAVGGSSGAVGVVGHLSGGGVGPLAATFGSASDHVLALEVVTGDGALHRATPGQNSDLFWAMRGGKAALGMITAVELRLFDVPEVYGGILYFAGSDAIRVVHEWARWSAQLPNVITTSLSLMIVPDVPHFPAAIAGRHVVALKIATPVGRDVGADRDRAEAVLTPMRQVAPAVHDAIGPMPYRDLADEFDDAAAPAPVHQDHALLTALPPEAVDAIIGAAGHDAGADLTVVEIRRLGGRLAGPPRHASAFNHRDSPYSLGVTAVLDDDSPSIVAAADRLMTAVEPWAQSSIFANFVDTTDQTRLARAYDSATVAKMRELSRIHDPAGVFNAPGELSLHRDNRMGVSGS